MKELCKNYTPDLSDDSVWIFNTPSENAASFLLYAQEAGIFHARSGYYTEYKDTSSFLIMLTTGGRGTYRINGHSYELTKNDLVFVDSMEYHTHETSKKGSGKWDILWVQFNGVNARAYYNQFKTANISVLNIGDNEKIPHILRKIVDINNVSTSGAEFSTSCLLVELLTEILFMAEAVFTRPVGMPEYIRAALKDIEMHFSDNLSLEYFAREYCVSKFHFAKEFKRFVGFSPVEYIINTRLNHAKELLRLTNMTVSEISESVGFNNNCHFINMFKQKIGITPYKFKKMYNTATELKEARETASDG